MNLNRLLPWRKFESTRVNVDTKRKLVFVHNPKCAGTSLRKALGFDISKADHRYPKSYLSLKEWEEFYIICVVREPLNRLLSAYRFHCFSNYDGVYVNKIPNLKNLDFMQYFNYARDGLITGLGPQHKFTKYPNSDKRPNSLLYFEELDTSLIPQKYFTDNIKELNSARQLKVMMKEIVIDHKEFSELVDYYRKDYDEFSSKYSIPSYKDLAKSHCIVI